MRPVRITVEGFSAYRERVEVGFEDVDFFSLAGPTGSGKSSLIDAMIFALYGRVPRLGGNAVAPAITAGSDTAKVALDFEVDGSMYTAVRMAQRTPSGGATVREARLQAGDSVLADGADNVTESIEDLLRLRFEDFIRTVVLPQGDFARFLTATKSERQGLLRNLLGLDMYTRVRELARTRAAVASERAEGARRSREDLAVPTEDEMAQLRESHVSLVALAQTVTQEEESLATLAKKADQAASAVAEVDASLGRLEAISPPERLEELEEAAASARSAVVDAEAAFTEWSEELAKRRQHLSALPSRDRIQSWSDARIRLQEVEESLRDSDLDAVVAQAEELEQEVRSAKDGLVESRSRLDQARIDHAAHALAANLTVGDTCPVCAREIAEQPELGELAILQEMEDAVSRADAEVETLRSSLEQASARVAAGEARRAQLEAQREQIQRALEDAPGSHALQSLTTELEEAEKSVRLAEEEVEKAGALLETRRKDLEEGADASRRVAKRLTEAQMSVASLDPPVPESDDVIVQWKELLAWRDATRDRLSTERNVLELERETITKEMTAAQQSLERRLREHRLEPATPYAVKVATAAEAARARVENAEAAAGKAEELAEIIRSASREAAVADTLAGHLKSNGFEQWLMSGALAELVEGANDLLGQLSNGSYSLHSDDAGTFSIVDHRNADEIRSVATLSGGETFLVSLALALSLAETLAARGGSGLDAIILDEGFGTLDDESLDVVATVLEELTGRGLMVGVITHVKELAARAPVRYEVTRGPTGSSVEVVS